jgi:hypothetical protein
MAVKRPPKLTRQEFLRKAPVNPVAGRTGGQRYQSYLTAYQNRYKPVRQQAPQNPVPTLQSLLARVGQFETPAQLEARANRMANQGVTAQQTIIREEAARMRAEAQSRMEAQSAAGRAAAQMNAGLFGMVGGEYNAGAQEIQGLGTNLSNQIVNTTEAQTLAQNAGLAQVGAPEMDVGGPAGSNSIAGAPQGAVSAYQFGNLPAQAITTAGAASQFGLAGMVSAQNLRATQEAVAGMNDSVKEANSARMSALKELAAGRPAQAAQFLQQLQEAQRQQIGLASGLIQQRAAMRQAGFTQGMTKKEYTQKVKQQQFQNKQALIAMGIDLSQVDPVKSQALGYVVNKRGQPILKNGQKIPAKKLLTALTGSKTANMTPGQKVDLLQKAQTQMDAMYYGYKVVDGKRVPATESPDFDPNDPSTWGTGAKTYSQAVSRLSQIGVPANYAKAMADSLYERGQGGRPLLTPVEARKLRKKMGAKSANEVLASIQKQIETGGPGADAAIKHRIAELLELIAGA